MKSSRAAHCQTCRCYPRRPYGATRDELLAFLLEHPGARWSELKAAVRFTDGVLANMVKRGLVFVRGERGDRRYFASRTARARARARGGDSA